jgi:hypothetical protein
MILADFHFPAALRGTVAQAARVVCPDDLDALGLVEEVVLRVEHGLRSYPIGVRTAFVAGLATLEASAVLRHGRRFSRLGGAEARAFYAAWWRSRVGPLRQLARTLKMTLALAYYDLPAVKARLEYHPDAWIAEAARRRLERYGIDIERHERELVAPDPLVPLGRRRRHA